MNIAINYLIARNLIISVSLTKTFGGSLSKAVFPGERRMTDYVQRIIEMPNILLLLIILLLSFESLIELSHKIMALL